MKKVISSTCLFLIIFLFICACEPPAREITALPEPAINDQTLDSQENPELGVQENPVAPALAASAAVTIQPVGQIPESQWVVFQWSPVANAVAYWLIVGDGLDIGSSVWIVNQSDIKGTSFKVKGSLFKPGFAYYWKVKSIPASGMGAWSSILSFTYGGAQLSTAMSPVGNITDPNVTFKWPAIPGAQSYWLIVAETPDVGGSILKPITRQDIPSNSYVASINGGFKLGKSYYWKVKAIKPDNSGLWTEIKSFFLWPATPNIYPVGEIHHPKPVFRWDHVSGATNYWLMVALSDNFSSGPVKINIKDVSDNYYPEYYPSVQQQLGLEPEVQYYWRVKSLFGSTPGSWSNVKSFIIKKPYYSQTALIELDSSVPANWIITAMVQSPHYAQPNEPGITLAKSPSKASLEIGGKSQFVIQYLGYAQYNDKTSYLGTKRNKGLLPPDWIITGKYNTNGPFVPEDMPPGGVLLQPAEPHFSIKYVAGAIINSTETIIQESPIPAGWKIIRTITSYNQEGHGSISVSYVIQKVQ
ncbi:MAG: hypothetical protein JXR70_15455 [Spirochaetales bacterium]|nr:hypothetical protein [Spirochaetales bacterium]